jgi:hypothetical protein
MSNNGLHEIQNLVRVFLAGAPLHSRAHVYDVGTDQVQCLSHTFRRQSSGQNHGVGTQPLAGLSGNGYLEWDTGPAQSPGNPGLDQHSIRFGDGWSQNIQISGRRDSHDPPYHESFTAKPARVPLRIRTVELSPAKLRLRTDLENVLDRLATKDAKDRNPGRGGDEFKGMLWRDGPRTCSKNDA